MAGRSVAACGEVKRDTMPRKERGAPPAGPRGLTGLILRMPIVGAAARSLAGRRFVVRGESMAPSLRQGDHLLVSRAAPGRGDVVVVRDPQDPAGRYVKRIVGLPGEEVRTHDGLLYAGGAHLDEPYLGGLPTSVGLDEAAWTLGAHQYFVAGDNRAHSTDSRHFGPVDREMIVGRVWLRYWPLRAFGRLRGGRPRAKRL